MLLYFGIFLLLLYFYIQWERKYFERRGVKYLPYKFPFIGSMLKVILQKEHFKDVVVKTYNSHPDQKVVGMMNFTRPVHLIKDLETIKNITIKDFDHFLNHVTSVDEDTDPLFGNNLFAMKDSKWRDMRSTLSPAFTSSKMRNMFQFIEEIGKQIAEFYEQEMKKPINKSRGLLEIEMKDSFTRYTNDVIATCAFGIKVNSLTEKDNDFYMMGKTASTFSGVVLLRFFLIFAFPRITKMLKMTLFKEESRDFFRHLVLDTMKQREDNHIVRNDMIQILMEAKKGSLKHESHGEEHDAGFATVEESHVGKETVKRKWTSDEIVAQAVVFFIAGFETASTLLCFVAHELTINPGIQKKLQEEIDDVLKKNDGELKYENLAKMKYMDMVISETLRLWPPAVASDRVCNKPYKIAINDYNKNYMLQPGDIAWIPIFAIHRDPKYYPNPEKFDPERFSDENKSSIDPTTYLPFGLGPRNCIGSRFALMEAKAVIFNLLAKFDFVETAKTQNPIKLATNTFNLHSEKGFWIGLKPRNL